MYKGVYQNAKIIAISRRMNCTTLLIKSSIDRYKPQLEEVKTIVNTKISID